MALELKQVDRALERFPGFRGTYPIDELPERIKPGQGLVANFERADEGGSHWVCVMYFKNPSKLVYYDSFGFPPPKTILKLLKRSADKSFFTLPDFQKYSSEECGMFCIAFLKSAFEGKDPEKDLKLNFTMHPSHQNEEHVKKVYEELE